MVSEITINRIESALTEAIEFSGTKEQTKIISNLEVKNATPTGLSEYITVEDSRDGDTILAKKLPGFIYANGDLVNVLFIEGTEPIAMQQASASGGVPFAVDRVFQPDFTTTVLTGDNSGDTTLTGDLIIPDDIIHSGDVDTLRSFTDDAIADQAGGVIMLRMTEIAQDLVEIGDVGGGGDVDINFNSGQVFIQGSDGKVGVGTIVIPHGGNGIAILALDAADASTDGPHIQTTTASDDYPLLQFLSYTHDSVHIYFDCYFTGAVWKSSDAGSNAGIVKNSDRLLFRHASGIAQGDNITLKDAIIIDLTSGDVGIGVTVPSAHLHVDQSSTTAAQPALLLDQADVSEQCIQFTSNGSDVDINLYTVDVTGTPTYLWDESEDAFSQDKGLRVTVGDVGIGLTTPRGKLDTFDSTGLTAQTKILTGIVGAAQTVVANGTGDAANGCAFLYVCYDDGGNEDAGVGELTQDAAPGSTFTITTVVANRIDLTLNADGSIDVIRAAGSRTFTLLLWLLYG